jgi:hypothetical protein
MLLILLHYKNHERGQYLKVYKKEAFIDLEKIIEQTEP